VVITARVQTQLQFYFHASFRNKHKDLTTIISQVVTNVPRDKCRWSVVEDPRLLKYDEIARIMVSEELKESVVTECETRKKVMPPRVLSRSSEKGPRSPPEQS
jgi:hypothetical protein